MANKTKDKVYDAAGNVKPYVDRALSDEKLRADVISAFTTARDVYNELIGSRTAATVATRVATDEEVRAKLRTAVEDLRSAADRLQGKRRSDRKRGRTVAPARHRDRHPLQPGHRPRDAQVDRRTRSRAAETTTSAKTSRRSANGGV